MRGLLSMAFLVAAIGLAAAQAPTWKLYKPGNTGIGGNIVMSFSIDPQNHKWVGARYGFWEEGGVAMFDDVKWTNYSNIDSPMPTDYVNSTAFAPNGVTWFGTDAGLVRFDGTSWTTYNRFNSPLPLDQIGNVQFDAQGRVWMHYYNVLLATEGIARFDGTTWKLWDKMADIGYDPSIQLSSLAVLPDGTAYLGTMWVGGMAYFNGTKWKHLDATNGYSDSPSAPSLEKDGHVWALWDGLKMLSGTTWITKPIPDPFGDYSSFCVNPDGTYYIGTFSGTLNYWNGSAWQGMFTPGWVLNLHTESNGQLWWTSNAELFKFVDWGGHYKAFNSMNTGMTEYFGNSISFDTAGKLWLGTSGGGVCSFDGTVWHGYNPYNQDPWGLPTDAAVQVLGAKDGTVWATLDLQGVAHFDGTKWTQYMRFSNVDGIAEGPDGKIWVTFYDGFQTADAKGVAFFNGTGFTRIDLHDAPLYANEIKGIYIDAQNHIYASCLMGLLTNETGAWTLLSMNDPAIGNVSFQALCATKTPGGDLWVGTPEGLVRRHNGAWTKMTEADGLPATPITCLDVRESDGLLAVGAFDANNPPYHGGVGLWNGTTWTVFTKANSPIQHEQVSSVKFDSHGDLWEWSQSEGIAKIGLAPNFVEVNPTAFSFTSGTLRSGGLSDLVASDDLRLIGNVTYAVAKAMPNLQLDITGTSSATTANSIDIKVESSGLRLGGTQKILAFDFVANAWVALDTSPLLTADTVRTVSIATNASRFLVGGHPKIRIEVADPHPSSRLTVNVDQVHWTIHP